MGIQGLIGFVSAATEQIEIDRLSGSRVAVDSYCWLHKGAFSCAEKLAIGEKTDQYVKYCTSFIKMLQSKNITPIMVFDGRHLPAKANEEKSRRDVRATNKTKAAQLLRTGHKDKARRYMAASIDVTHAMALHLIQTCREMGIDSIVAPYEADAQLAYLNMRGYVDAVVTEDSDLILFGCHKVVFKLQRTGSALLYERKKLPQVMQMPEDKFDFSLFRRMCILSGCDYLPSLPGIGLMKAKKFILRTRDVDISDAIQKIGQYLNMPNLKPTEEYIDNFRKAEATFMFQYVYDPKQRQLVRLTDASDITEDLLVYSGKHIEPDEAFQHALGNTDPFSKKVMDNWNPDSAKLSSASIWSNAKTFADYFKPVNRSESAFVATKLRQKSSPIKTETPPSDDDVLSDGELRKLYGCTDQTDTLIIKKRKFDDLDENEEPVEIKRVFPVKKHTISIDSTGNTNNGEINHLQQIKTTLSPRSLSLTMDRESTPPRTPRSISSEISPPLTRKRRKHNTSKFITQTSTEEKATSMSAFFQKSPVRAKSGGDTTLDVKVETKVAVIELLDIAIDCDKTNQNTCVLNRKKSVSARPSGLSKTFRNTKTTELSPSQSLLSRFGFVKKPQLI